VSIGLEISAQIDGRSVSRHEVLEWEARRAAVVAKKLGVDLPAGDPVAQRTALVERKLELGREELERRLARQLALSARSGRLLAALSGKRRRLCAVELSGSGGSAEAMPGYYQAAMESGDEAALLAASPDHYVLRQNDGGVQQVIETTGGSPLPARIFLDPDDSGTVLTEADPAFPVQWVAIGRGSLGGRQAGALRHQFRDDADGFRARLTIEFPAATPSRLVHAHKWHLACEFSNWIEAANGVSTY
jgi:hypothetical protein